MRHGRGNEARIVAAAWYLAGCGLVGAALALTLALLP